MALALEVIWAGSQAGMVGRTAKYFGVNGNGYLAVRTKRPRAAAGLAAEASLTRRRSSAETTSSALSAAQCG